MSNWLVGCFGFSGTLRQYSVYIGPSPRKRETKERLQESKNVQLVGLLFWV